MTDLTQVEIIQIKSALSYWQPRLASEWTIGFNPDERPQTDDNCRGELARSEDYLMATLRVRPPSTWTLSSEDWPLHLEVEEMVVHELGHCIIHDLQLTHDLAHHNFANDAWRVQRNQFMHHLERVIERWSRTLVALRYDFDPIKGPKNETKNHPSLFG